MIASNSSNVKGEIIEVIKVDELASRYGIKNMEEYLKHLTRRICDARLSDIAMKA